jgi:hypothetical protein
MQKRGRLEGLIHVRVTRELEGALRLAAGRQGVTISEYIISMRSKTKTSTALSKARAIPSATRCSMRPARIVYASRRGFRVRNG